MDSTRDNGISPQTQALVSQAQALFRQGKSEAEVASALGVNGDTAEPPPPKRKRRATPLATGTPFSEETASPPGLRLSDVRPSRVSWLWPGRIPLGKLTVLDGDPGLGKSLLTLDIAARVSTARAMPDGSPCDLLDPAGVVLLSAEDDLSDTIRPRLEAAGADLSRIVALTAKHEQDGFTLPTLADLDLLERALTGASARLLVVDPLMAYLPEKVNAHRDQDIRRALSPLTALAAETGVAVLVVRHLNKTALSNALYRGGGSIGIVGAARSGLLVAPDPDDQTGERRILAATKSNLAKLPSALAYRIEATETGIPVIAWQGATSHTATSLLSVPMDVDAHSALDEAMNFLIEVLADGPVPAKEVEDDRLQCGISKRTLDRAKSEIGVKAYKIGKPGEQGQRWVWQLPSDPTGFPKDAKNAEECQ